MIKSKPKSAKTTKPLLSVFMITYNHEKYIKHALESILMQKTTFPFEVIIGEDCSSDKTREICLEYQKKYPKKIRVLNNFKNLGIKKNFIRTLRECNGAYVAYLEGDDYWIDEMKLQKQVDFLENNLSYSITCHKAKIYDMTKKEEYSLSDVNTKDISTIHDLTKSNYIYANSVVFRNRPKDLIKFELDSFVADWVLWVFLAQFGKIKYFREEMSVYRLHDGGVFSREGVEEKYDMAITAAKNWNRLIGRKCEREFKEFIGLCYFEKFTLTLKDHTSSRNDKIVDCVKNLGKLIEDNPNLINQFNRLKVEDRARFPNKIINKGFVVTKTLIQPVRKAIRKIKYMSK